MISQFELIWYRRLLFWVGVVGFSLVIPIGIATLALLLGDASDADRWSTATLTIQLFNAIVGLVLGALMGGVEHRNGMQRYIALTGTSRVLHALGRLGGAIAFWAITVVVATLVALLIMLAANGWPEAIEHPLRIWLAGLLPGLTYIVLGFGLARLVGSSGIAIAILLGVVFVLEQVLLVIPKVGPVWAEISIPIAYLELLGRAYSDVGPDPVQTLLQSVVVLLGWTCGVLALGLLVDLRRDL